MPERSTVDPELERVAEAIARAEGHTVKSPTSVYYIMARAAIDALSGGSGEVPDLQRPENADLARAAEGERLAGEAPAYAPDPTDEQADPREWEGEMPAGLTREELDEKLSQMWLPITGPFTAEERYGYKLAVEELQAWLAALRSSPRPEATE